MAETSGAQRGLDRFEGFTDAVFAIALTLLIVEIKPPGSPDGPKVGDSLLHAVAEQWREHLALLLSFAVIGAYWLQHHYSGRIYAKSDHFFSLINLGFLLAVTVVPYPLRVWCFHLGTPHVRTASVGLAVGLFAPSVFWMLKWHYAKPQRRLMDERLADDFINQLTRRYSIGTLLTGAAIPVAFVAPPVGVTLALAVVVFFLLPSPRPRYKPRLEPTEDEKASE